MSDTTKASVDKVKLFNQMLEDLAGDEYEDYDAELTISTTLFLK